MFEAARSSGKSRAPRSPLCITMEDRENGRTDARGERRCRWPSSTDAGLRRSRYAGDGGFGWVVTFMGMRGKKKSMSKRRATGERRRIRASSSLRLRPGAGLVEQ